jgi:hypothetical protein
MPTSVSAAPAAMLKAMAVCTALDTLSLSPAP